MWATVAPLEIPGNSTFIAPYYTTFFTLTSEPRYLSTIPRDNIYRQFFSLWLITVLPTYHCISNRIVDLWRSNLLYICQFIVLFYFRSHIPLSSQIPRQSNPQGNYADNVLVTTNGGVHCPMVRRRSEGVFKVVFGSSGVWMVVYRCAVPDISRVYGWFNLLDPSRTTSSFGV